MMEQSGSSGGDEKWSGMWLRTFYSFKIQSNYLESM